jgi:single-strand DNA-binding protein
MSTRVKDPPTAQPPTTPPPEAESTDGRQLPSEIARVGNLTRDPERGFGKERGTPYARFGLAVNRPKTPGDWAGEMVTTFYEVAAFGSLAEHVCESLQKGHRIVVVGRPEIDTWTDDDGQTRETRKIIASAIGPDLRWSTAVVNRASSRAASTAVSYLNDEEPF